MNDKNKTVEVLVTSTVILCFGLYYVLYSGMRNMDC